MATPSDFSFMQVFDNTVCCVEGTHGGSLLIESRGKKTIAERISNKNANVQRLVSVDAFAVPVSGEKTMSTTVSSAIGCGYQRESLWRCVLNCETNGSFTSIIGAEVVPDSGLTCKCRLLFR